MLWEDVRIAFEDKWVVLEAIIAYSDNNKRIVEDMAVLDCFDDSMEALRRHAELHKLRPECEYYFFHTSRKNLDILEKKWTGRFRSSVLTNRE